MNRRQQRFRKRRAIKAAKEREVAERKPEGIQPGAWFSAWGQGRLTRSDLVMVQAAIREGYPIDDALRESIVVNARQVMEGKPSDRTRIAAMRVLLAADQLNVARERLASEERRPQSVVNVFDRAQVLLQQLAQSPPACPPDSPVAGLPHTAD